MIPVGVRIFVCTAPVDMLTASALIPGAGGVVFIAGTGFCGAVTAFSYFLGPH